MATPIDPAMALFTDEPTEEPQDKTIETKEELKETTTGNKEQDNLGSDHPRFQQIYGKMKGFERNLTDRDTQIKNLIDHNNKLTEAIGSLDSKVAEAKRPDPSENPELYEEWLTEKIMKQMKSPAPVKVSAPTPVVTDQKLVMQENAMAAVYDDFYEILGVVGEEMKTNEMLREEIMTHQNPPRKLYTYYQNKLKRDQSNSDDVNERSQTENGGFATKGNTSGTLSADQKKMAVNLGLSVDVYKKQLDFISKKR